MACASLVATLWLAAGVPGLKRATSPSLVGALSRGLATLYAPSPDETLYYFTASQLLGQPFAGPAPDRGLVPDAFARPPLASDGRWHVPYREVPLEYPPLALPWIVWPRLIAARPAGYRLAFELGMAALIMLAAALVVRSLPERSRASGAWYFLALLLAHGALVVQRLDAFVALLFAAALYALARRRPVLFGAALGLLGAAKLVPVLLAPVLVLGVRELTRPPALVRCAAAFAIALGLGLSPLLLASQHAFADLLAYHSARGLQVESGLGSAYGLARALAGQAEPTVTSYGSDNFPSPIASQIAALCMPLTIVLLGALALAAWRTRRAGTESQSLAALCACALSILWLSGKVFSPQYMTWVLPIAIALPWARERALLLAMLALSQIYFRLYFDDVMAQTPRGILMLVLRQVLVASFAYGCFRRWRAGLATSTIEVDA
jgi:hypothetical protein